MNVEGVSILARGITAKGPAGSVFENIDLRVDSGDLAIVSGASGTGRTCMLLALSGRLRLVAGHLKVSGLVLPRRARAVRKLITPARLSPGFELESRHRVRQAINERRMISKLSRDAIEDAFFLVGADPKPSTLVGDLHPGERLLLEVALAAATSPAGMLVDDVDLGLPSAARARVWSALRAVTATGTTVLASVTEPPDGSDTVIRLPHGLPDLYDHPEPPDIADSDAPTEEIPLRTKVIELPYHEQQDEDTP